MKLTARGAKVAPCTAREGGGWKRLQEMKETVGVSPFSSSSHFTYTPGVVVEKHTRERECYLHGFRSISTQGKRWSWHLMLK